MEGFEKELTELINRYSKENESNTPDFILAKYMNAALENINAIINDREKWYGRQESDYNDSSEINPFARENTK